MTWRQWCVRGTCCRPFHSLLEEDLAVLLFCRGVCGGGSSSSSTAGIGLTGMMGASSRGAVRSTNLFPRNSRMVWTKERYLQENVVPIVNHIRQLKFANEHETQSKAEDSGNIKQIEILTWWGHQYLLKSTRATMLIWCESWACRKIETNLVRK